MNIAHAALDRHVAEGRGDRPALLSLGRRYEKRHLSYAQLADLSARLAAALAARGIGAGDTVAVLTGRSVELYVAAFGCWKIGAVFCPLFSAFGPGPLKSRLELSGAKALIATEDLYRRKVAGLRASLPDLSLVLLVGEDGRTVTGADGEDFNTAIAAATPAATAATAPETPAFLHFTSGTTGTPKGVLHSHSAVIAETLTARQVFGLVPDDVYWCTADPGWITNTAYAQIAPLANGCMVVVDEADFDPRRWYGILKDEKVTVWYTTPTNIRMMMRYGAALARSYKENSLRVAASVGEPLNPEAVAWGEKALGVPFLDTWWQTETGAIAIANCPGRAKAGSMGMPLPGVQAAVIDRDLSRITSVERVDEVGELALRADLPSMFTAYMGEGAHYDSSFVDGWYLTGDLVRRDADGCFWFVGRADDMIKSASHTIGPFEVECGLMDHPAVAEIGVVGKPDLLLREVPVAFISLNPGFEAGEALRIELLTFARQCLGATLAPREIHFVETMPKTSTGKILRRALKAKAVAEPEEDESHIIPVSPGRFDDE
ncbi:AMP-binding protein [Magnetospirillum sp. J10]|uniref:acetate--CoA ligase n=2 Tax=Magnetospirillum sulfuroxidans TaxID=611300 RepID=A0ABS5I6U3_9PROT|nr:AMP-binding protein [Magnetospirillum sulfuroxidans]